MQHNMDTQAARIGRLMGEILGHAMPQEVIGRLNLASKKPIPKNKSETVVFRRWLPKGATTSTPNTWAVTPATHQLVEGETPVGESISAQDISVSLVQFGVLYRYSDRVNDLYEDDVPAAMKQLTGERMGLVLELVRIGVLKASTNIFRSGGVAARSSITSLLTASGLNAVSRSLANNLAMKMTRVLSASPGVGTQPIEAAYIVVHHPDLEADLRSQLTGFVHVSEYGTRQVLHPNETGSWQQFRFVAHPHLAPYLNAGTTGGANTRLAGGVANSTGAELVDVYPMLVFAEEAFGDTMLRGMDSFEVSDIKPSVQSKEDPLGQRGYIGTKTYFNSVILNDGHMAVYEVAASFQA